MVRVIQICLGIKITVACIKEKLSYLPPYGEICTVSFCLIHILVLACLNRVIPCNPLRRSLVIWYGYESYHIVQLVVITAQGYNQIAERVFYAGREVVAGLCLQIFVAYVEICSGHLLHIHIAQLLRSRRFKALAPGSPQPQVICSRPHHGEFWSCLESKLMVLIKPQSCGNVELL